MRMGGKELPMMTPSSRRVRWALAFLLGATPIVVGAGCLDFKQETLLLRFEDDANTLTCLLVYEGLNAAPGGSQKEADSLEQAKTQLASFLANQGEFCLFDNWIGHIVLSPNPKDEAKVASQKRKIARLIEIRNRAFLLNERGELCAYQTITIPNVRKFEDGLNELISEVSDESITSNLAIPAEERPGKLSEESLRIIQTAARKGHRWVRISPARVEFDLPITRADAERMIDPSNCGIDISALKAAIPGLPSRPTTAACPSRWATARGASSRSGARGARGKVRSSRKNCENTSSRFPTSSSTNRGRPRR
jgi:hypothetical protein